MPADGIADVGEMVTRIYGAAGPGCPRHGTVEAHLDKIREDQANDSAFHEDAQGNTRPAGA
jgi:hypothetical protein